MDAESLFSVKGKVVLITGGAKGIGRMIAEGFIRSGAKVYLTGRDASALNQAVTELTSLSPSSLVPVAIPADLQKLEACQDLASRLSTLEPGGLHVLVNNAGATWGASVDEYPDSGWTKVLTLNLQRVFTLTQLCLPLLERAAAASSTNGEAPFADPARIINIGSIDGVRVPVFQNYAYSAAKAGLHQLSAHLARDLGPRGITSNVLACGPFPTKMLKSALDSMGDSMSSEIPSRRVGTPQDAAGAALFLASRAGAYCNGALIRLDGGTSLVSKL